MKVQGLLGGGCGLDKAGESLSTIVGAYVNYFVVIRSCLGCMWTLGGGCTASILWFNNPNACTRHHGAYNCLFLQLRNVVTDIRAGMGRASLHYS